MSTSAARSATFRDSPLEDEYLRRGIVVTPFLDADEVRDLRAAYRSLVPPGDDGLTIDYMRPDREYMARIAELVAPVWERHFPALFVDHRPVFTTFVTKYPGPASEMFLHDDRTYVDERVHRAGVLWIPLVDVGPGLDNGGLQVIPCSHLLTSAWSGTNTPELFRPYETYLRRHLEPLSVPAGSAAFYDSRLLHASPPNLSREPREVIVCAVAPRTAALIHVVATTPRHRRVHRVDERYFLETHPHTVEHGLPSEYPVIEEYDDDETLSPERVAAVLGTDEVPVPDDPAA